MIGPSYARPKNDPDPMMGPLEMGSGAGGLEDSQLERLGTDVIRFMA